MFYFSMIFYLQKLFYQDMVRFYHRRTFQKYSYQFLYHNSYPQIKIPEVPVVLVVNL